MDVACGMQSFHTCYSPHLSVRCLIYNERTSLTGRTNSRSWPRFPSEPPKGKGSRVVEASGSVASARLPLLHIVQACRREQGANVLVAADSSIASDH